jgi:hypothetical protein
MSVNFQQLIKSCGTLTNPAAETKSIGLPADAQVLCFLLEPRQFSHEGKLSFIYQDKQKTRHRDTNAN